MGRLCCVWEAANESAVLFLSVLEFREKQGGSWRYVLHLGNSSNQNTDGGDFVVYI